MKTPSPEIALIECWLGPFPPWRPLFEASCRANPNLEFLVFTDQVTATRREGNITYHPLTRGELEARIADRAGQRLSLLDGWRLCKLKPAYGLLFADHLKPYQFWGFHDSDLVWGNTRSFFTAERLARFDVISPSAAWLVGHLSLFKIGSGAGRPDLIIPGYWNQVLRDSHKGVAIDEELLDHALSRLERRGEIRILRAQWLLGDGFHPRWRRRAEDNIRTGGLDAADFVMEDGECRWNGTTLRHERSGREALYFHFQHWKRAYRAGRVAFDPCVAEYRFSPERIAATRFATHGPHTWAYWLRHEARHRIVHRLKILKADFHRAVFGDGKP